MPYNAAMTADEKLAAILAAVQTDAGNRGLARDPADNLFTATAGDFQAACRSIADHPNPALDVATGFFIPTGKPPSYETDGPLGAVHLVRALAPLGIHVQVTIRYALADAIRCGLSSALGADPQESATDLHSSADYTVFHAKVWGVAPGCTHTVHIEQVGPAIDGRCYSMRGRDITEFADPHGRCRPVEPANQSIGIGDGGNEVGMGKISRYTVMKNVANGGLIHCVVPTQHLIVAGVSNWGAYALAAGVYVLRGTARLPADLFDLDRERWILEVMVREGPLVDGVTGQQTATVDGLTWDEYAAPLIRIREILES